MQALKYLSVPSLGSSTTQWPPPNPCSNATSRHLTG
jgi:hypothetical protein